MYSSLVKNHRGYVFHFLIDVTTHFHATFKNHLAEDQTDFICAFFIVKYMCLGVIIIDIKKEQQAINRLRAFEPEDQPYWLAYSGGKDSDVIRILASLAGVRHEIHHNLTTADAPETMQYIKSIDGVIIDKQRYSDGTPKTMWNLIVKRMMPPTRIVRYCCKELKEGGGSGRLVITGVRWDESVNRRKNSGMVQVMGKGSLIGKILNHSETDWRHTEKNSYIINFDNEILDDDKKTVRHCYEHAKTVINPIVDWTEDDVWTFLHHYGCEGNPLYQCGEKRVGCIGCPMSGFSGMKSDLQRYPKYRDNYLHAFERMIQNRIRNGKTIRGWETPEEVMRWWIGDKKCCDYDEETIEVDEQ